MDNRNGAQKDEQEIIEQREVKSNQPQRVKIKIKERVLRRERKKVSWLFKLFVLLVASYLGFTVGSKIVNRYFSYWKKPYVKYRDSKEESGATRQLEAGQIFSLDQK